MSRMRRAIVIVMDGCGAGEAPDAAEFGDLDHPATIRHVYEANGGLNAPNLAACGFLAACGAPTPAGSGARYGRLRELSKGGKDSVTGHWEMSGIVTEQPFPTYPLGFPPEVIAPYESAIGRKVLGNKPASGTEIIKELGAEHFRTGFPIVYTSADSVFQVACHESVIPVAQLYEFCQTARAQLVPPHGVQRVIARPFAGTPESGFTRTERRRDFPMPPPPNLCDRVGDVFGIGVVPELFAGRGFRTVHRTQNNAEHTEMLWQALDSDARFIWANFEDFDMRYGHRNDPIGFARCLEEFDRTLGEMLSRRRPDDLIILTADHGNDPTTLSTDHSREFVPFVAISSEPGKALGSVDGMTAVGASVAAHVGVDWAIGTVLLGDSAV
jgi:phosphopentomutase